MQKRSDAYQAIISITLEHVVGGIAYDQLVTYVAAYVDPDRAHAYRLGKLKRMPNETDAETTAKGQREIARRYIDAAQRQGLVLYGETPPSIREQGESDSHGRYVYWRRFARNGGRYGTPEANEELRRHQLFMSGHLDNGPDETGEDGVA